MINLFTLTLIFFFDYFFEVVKYWGTQALGSYPCQCSCHCTWCQQKLKHFASVSECVGFSSLQRGKVKTSERTFFFFFFCSWIVFTQQEANRVLLPVQSSARSMYLFVSWRQESALISISWGPVGCRVVHSQNSAGVELASSESRPSIPDVFWAFFPPVS